MRALAVAFAVGSLTYLTTGCSPDLGDAPFRCNNGEPECPIGYRCNTANLCVPEDLCPPGIAGCDPLCGDGACDEGESCASCEADCGACAPSCGDGSCDAQGGEDCRSCEKDCGTCAPSCGDHFCDRPSESCTSCPDDCGNCAAQCGDGTCDGDESCSSCAVDCGACQPASCGDGTCNMPTEDCHTCAVDCGTCPARCGDGSCDAGEDCGSCSIDCGACQPVCGDGTCDSNEDCKSCAKDCGACPVCSVGEKTCQDATTLAICQNNVWAPQSCDDKCRAAGKDYASGCVNGACACGDYQDFGDLCNSTDKRCKGSLVCATFDGKKYGFCTKVCTDKGKACSGGGYAQWPECSDKQVNGQLVCRFWCDDQWGCPYDMTCSDSFLGGYCIPRK